MPNKFEFQELEESPVQDTESRFDFQPLEEPLGPVQQPQVDPDILTAMLARQNVPSTLKSTTAGGPPISVSPANAFLPLMDKEAFDIPFAPLDPTPRINLSGLVPEVKPDDSIVAAASKTLAQAGLSLPDFFTSDAGITTLGVAPFKVLHPLVGAYWSQDLLRNAWKQAQESTDNWNKLTDAQKTQAILNVAISTGMGVGAAGLGMRPTLRKVSPGALGETVAKIPKGQEGAVTAIKVLEQAKTAPVEQVPVVPAAPQPAQKPEIDTTKAEAILPESAKALQEAGGKVEAAGAKPAEAAVAMQAGVEQRLAAGKAAPTVAAEAAQQRASEAVKPGYKVEDYVNEEPTEVVVKAEEFTPTIPLPKGKKPLTEADLSPGLEAELAQEGVSSANIKALLNGSKTVEQIVEDQLGVKRLGKGIDASTMIVEENPDGSRSIGFGPEAGPSSTVPVNVGQMSHIDAIEMGRQQGIDRINEVLAKYRQKGAPNAQAVRSDTGLVEEKGIQPQAGQNVSGENLEQPAPGRPEPVGAGGQAKTEVLLKRLPRLKKGYVRLWRGSKEGTEGAWFSDQKEIAEFHFENQERPATLSYIDVPEDQAFQFSEDAFVHPDVKSGKTIAESGDHVLPPELASKAVIVKRTSETAISSAAAQAPKAKEPWEMTQEQVAESSGAFSPGVVQNFFKFLRSFAESPEASKRTSSKYPDYDYAARMSGVTTDGVSRLIAQRQGHHEAVAKAVAEGKPVPAEVLADYPDLAGKAAPSAPQAPAPSAAETVQSVLAPHQVSKRGEIFDLNGKKLVSVGGQSSKKDALKLLRIYKKDGAELVSAAGKYIVGIPPLEPVKIPFGEGRFRYRDAFGNWSYDDPNLGGRTAVTDPRTKADWDEEVSQQPTTVPPEQPKGPGIAPGPGAMTAGAPPDKSQIEQLAADFSQKAPTKQRAAALVRQSFDFGRRKSEAADLVSKAINALRTSGTAIWKAATGFEKPSELLQAKGDLSAALESRGWRVREFARNVKKALPDVRRRAAISKYIEAGGDNGELMRGEAETKPEFRAAYRDARNLTPEEKVMAENISNYFDARLQEAIDAGVLENGITDYIHRIYEKRPDFRDRALAYVQSGILSKNPSLAKKRLFQFDWEAEKLGYRPVQDFLPRVTDYETSLSRAIAAREFIAKLSTLRASDGRPIIGIKAVGVPIEDATGVREGTLIKPHGDFKKALDPTDTANYRGDYQARPDYRALSKWKWVSEDADGKPIFVQGDVAIHPEYLSRVDALLEPSKVRFGRYGKIGGPALTFGSTIKQTMLDLSMFHQVQIAVHGMEHRVWSIPGPRLLPGMSKIVQNIDFENPNVQGLLKGGVTLGGEYRGQHLGEGLVGSSLTRHIPGLGPIMESYHEWLFQSFIPRVKMTMALHALERNRQRYANDLASGRMTDTDLNFLTAKQANAAFGELNYIMMERSKTTQDIARLIMLAPDFLEARAKFVGQALTKYGTEQRVALLLGALTLYTTARIVNKALDDQWHFEPENLFNVIYKNNAYSLRTVQGDVIHALTKPLQFWLNRLNPTYTRSLLELVSGRDQFGRKRDFWQVLGDTVSNVVPIALRSSRERSIWESMLNATGVTARRYNDVQEAMKLASEWKKKNNVREAPGEFVYDSDKDPLRPLKIALSQQDEPGTMKEFKRVLESKAMKPEQVDAYFRRYVNAPFTGSKANEARFLKDLSGDERKTVQGAMQHRQKMGVLYWKARRMYYYNKTHPE